MPLVQCPHCGAENFTMEGWEDLDRCSSCGKPLGEPEGSPVDNRTDAGRIRGRGAVRPRPASAGRGPSRPGGSPR